MQYYAAPMEGLTDRVWRQAQQKWFGPEGTAHRYYAPFLSPPENRVLIKKKMAELAPAANPGAPVIPQLLAKDGELAAWMIGELRALGYTEVNLNLGCPSGTVTAKGKGSGMLRDPAVLDAFLDAVFSHAEGPISVKTRLGVSSPDEFAAILDIYDRYPICELTIHPRVMRQLYRGQADRAAFAEALPRCTMPVCYNGDVTTPEELHALATQFPQLSGIMIGRGFIADPALLRRARGGTGASREELRGYLDDLYHGYTELFGSAGCAVSRMKAHWFYLIHRFAGSEKLEKQLRKAREPWEYEVYHAGKKMANLLLYKFLQPGRPADSFLREQPGTPVPPQRCAPGPHLQDVRRRNSPSCPHPPINKKLRRPCTGSGAEKAGNVKR